jgi:hypothetical protein
VVLVEVPTITLFCSDLFAATFTGRWRTIFLAGLVSVTVSVLVRDESACAHCSHA